jgi:hypothetical protein
LTTSIANAAAALFWNVVYLLIIPTAALFVLRRYMPFVGQPLWQMYQRLLIWCVAAPFRAIRALVQAATTHHK